MPSIEARSEREVAGSATKLPFRRVFVTGAHGFVGRQLVPLLADRLAKGAFLFLGTRMASASPRSDDCCIRFDLEDCVGVADAIAETMPDLVIHLAAQASVGRSAKLAADTWSVNLCGSLSLARALSSIVPDCTVLFVSSAEVYGLTFNREIVTESSALSPQSVYARSKAAAEAMFADVLPLSSRLIVARPSNHTGPGQDEGFVIPAFAAQIARIEKGIASDIKVGNLDAARDFLDVRDVVEAYLALLMGADDLPQRSTFNIASGYPERIGAILDRLRVLSPIDTVITQDSQRMRPSEVSRAAIDASKIKQAVKWGATCSLDDTLFRVLAYYRARV